MKISTTEPTGYADWLTAKQPPERDDATAYLRPNLWRWAQVLQRIDLHVGVDERTADPVLVNLKDLREVCNALSTLITSRVMELDAPPVSREGAATPEPVARESLDQVNALMATVSDGFRKAFSTGYMMARMGSLGAGGRMPSDMGGAAVHVSTEYEMYEEARLGDIWIALDRVRLMAQLAAVSRDWSEGREQAAKVCDRYVERLRETLQPKMGDFTDRTHTLSQIEAAEECARRIRALPPSSPESTHHE